MQEKNKQDIRKLDLAALEHYFVSIGEKKFRARQVYEWLWNKSLKNFDDMTNISKTTREILKENFSINHIHVDHFQRSSDGTIKNAVKLFDNKIVESVLIPTTKRITACVSSQVGCSLDCNFCATARLKRMRNLNPDEIYDQVVAIQQEARIYYERPLTNIVFMGMGEPLLNYQNVLAAIEKICSPEGLGISPKRITLSTVGIAKMIRKLADEEVKFNLALSLHSAINETRSRLMPINESNTVEDLADALKYWYAKTKRKVTYEYVIWDGINDDEAHARALVKFCKHVPSKVNIIQYNPIDEGEFRQASADKVALYLQILNAAGIVAKVRKSRGQDIDAACGQLANKNEV
ncbi:23S rRNA (adenine(2503)-C(2))-methyltransferase RlmN [Cyclobacterium plantarum]|uniref:Probable dual-specificity RNA methyltransferase RlmN n=1 Tax=Cyclobacterium plantarum TaxID=2716263 RepID=A0ABX0HI45_9BACT|nr:23S rRNA (adenine(2503)-C(2))-methyltransferase RlmN [Cyclobacterium plantarum]NHE59827.1 23S rRNA (adenine(2503)-C(2))-methyltransferase RlmN [Cyclobacterium plantarum]